MAQTDHAHIAAALVTVPVAFALARLSDAAFVGCWSLGSMKLTPVSSGVYRGVSLFDSSHTYVDIRPSPDLGLIDFGVGTRESRVPRIFIRATSGAVLGHDDGSSLVTMTALRAATADAATWSRTCTTHDAEILLIKAQLESAYAKGVP